jgi:hypothetical protein
MSWIVPTISDLQKALSAPEYAAYTDAALALDAAEILADQVRAARGYCPSVEEITTSIPPELKGAVIKLAVVELLRGVPSALGSLEDVLNRRYDEAMKVLRDVAAGTLKITLPTTQTGPTNTGTQTINESQHERFDLL